LQCLYEKGLETPFLNLEDIFITGEKKTEFPSGLPDIIFGNQISQFELIFECLSMKDFGKFYIYLVYIYMYFTAILYILLPFVIFLVMWEYFSHFGMLSKDKSGNHGFYLC
jgi:hypothetical protein